MTHARRQPFARRGLLRRAGPFAFVMLAAFAATPMFWRGERPWHLALAAALNVVIALAAVLAPWSRLPRALQAGPPLAYFGVIALLQAAHGSVADGYTPLVILPVLWLVLYGTRGQLLAALGLVAPTLLTPLVVHAAEAGASDWRRAVLWLVVAPLTGLLLRRLLDELLERLDEEQRASGRRLVQAQEAERRRIASELHDQVGQDLTALVLKLGQLVRNTDGAAERQADEAREAARHSLSSVRQIARQLRPEALDDFGLPSALAALAQRLSEHSGLPIERHLAEPIPPLGDEAEVAVYRVAQEGLTNALRHAEPTQVSVSLVPEADGVLLSVCDDGRGVGGAEPGFGVRGMHERAHFVDGRLSLRGRAGGGTELCLRVPGPA